MMLILIGIILVIAYTIYLNWVIRTWDKIPSIDLPSGYRPQTSIAVIIPVRNEENYIEQCIQSIINCQYPNHLLDIIIINDHSTDETVGIVQKIRNSSIKLLNLSDYIADQQVNAYKKLAIKYGIEHTDASLIITTDGDSFVPIDYLQSYSYYYESYQPKIIAGPVVFNESNSFIEAFQSFDMMTMMGITAAGIQSQKYFLANGANLGFEKEAFLSLEPFDAMDTASGDDMFLIQSMAQKYPRSVHYLKHQSAIVTTALTHGLSPFLQQRKRWASKSKQYQESNIKFLMVFVFFVNVFPLLSSIMGILFFNNWWIILGLIYIIAKYIIDKIYINRMVNFFNRNSILSQFYKSYIFYYFYILYTGLMGIFPRKYEWKNRKVN